ncbi:MAG TPA: hypothetical protein PLV83_05425, partial [Bacilli bacterium]|nr:hypothetical protein [Bacilli bacterium]
LFFVMSLSIGYAYISQNMDIKGEVFLRATKDIRITSISDFASMDNAYEKYNPKYDTNSITTNVSLPNLTSYATYTVTIANNGTAAMKIKNITPTSSNQAMTYDIKGVGVGTIIAGIDSLTFTVKLRYSSLTTTIPENIDYSLILNFEFEQYVPLITSGYSTDNLLLDLRGVDAPENNIWYDHDNRDNKMTLTNATYDSETKSYTFGNKSFANLGKAIIPETGNFTLETYIKVPDDNFSNTDQSIVSQVNDSANDDGRIKINYTVKSKVKSLLVFSSETAINNNTFNYFSQSVETSSMYCLQLVRTNSKLELYLNGKLITTADYPSANKISQSNFKIGKWNAKDLQYFYGKVYSVRLYNRILTPEELEKHYNIDKGTYKEGVVVQPPITVQYSSIFEYVVNEEVVTSGDGLYKSGDSYIYKGIDPNNYIKFKNNDDVYRIISFEKDGTMKLVNETYKYNTPFDESGNRDITTSPFCTYSSKIADKKLNQYYGCNAWSKNTNVVNDSTISNYLNTTYYDSLPTNIKSNIVSHNFASGSIGENITNTAIINSTTSTWWNGKIGLITVVDLANSTNETLTIGSGESKFTSWIISNINKSDAIWTMNSFTGNTWDIYTVLGGTSIGKRRASRYEQASGNITYKFLAMPSFYVSSIKAYSGIGTATNPFIID